MSKQEEEKDKIEVVSQETNEVKHNKEIEYVSQESIPLADYSYGDGQEQLNYDVALRDQPNIRRAMFLS